MKKQVLQVAVALVFGATVHDGAQAQSIYSSKGLGLRHYFVSGQSMGMGRVGLAVADRLTLNFANPATLTELPVTFISGNLLHSANDMESASQDAFVTNTNVSGLQFLIPIERNRIAFALGVVPYSAIEFAFTSNERSMEGKRFTEQVAGDGGVNSGFLSLAVRPHDDLYLGVSGIFYFGTLRRQWQVDFESPSFLDTQDEVSQSFTSGSVTIGLLYRILPDWNVAATLTPGITLDVNKSVTARRSLNFEDLDDENVQIPLAFGVGTAVNLGERVLVAMDYYQQQWSGGNLQSEGYVNDSRRIGAGIEFSGKRSPGSSYLNWVDYRAGFYYNDLGLELPIGERVTEIFGTIGLGLPIKWNAAKVNLALEAGQRGSSGNPFTEKIVRFSADITVGERWFVRGR